MVVSHWLSLGDKLFLYALFIKWLLIFMISVCLPLLWYRQFGFSPGESCLCSGPGARLSVLISIIQWFDLAFCVRITQCSCSCFICISFELGSKRIQLLKNMPRQPESTVALRQWLSIPMWPPLCFCQLWHLGIPSQIHILDRKDCQKAKLHSF